MTAPRFRDVPVDDGDLAVLVADPGVGDRRSAVLVIHDLVANGRIGGRLLERLPTGWMGVAPDLRGRAASSHLPPVGGIHQHAADLTAVLDALDVREVVVVGHGFGALVADVLATRWPDAVSATVAVVPARPVADLWSSALDRTFTDRDAHRRHWQVDHAMGQAWSSHHDAFVDHALGGVAPRLHWRVDRTVIDGDRAALADDGSARDQSTHASRIVVVGDGSVDDGHGPIEATATAAALGDVFGDVGGGFGRTVRATGRFADFLLCRHGSDVMVRVLEPLLSRPGRS